jgi:hypothetical protein
MQVKRVTQGYWYSNLQISILYTTNLNINKYRDLQRGSQLE